MARYNEPKFDSGVETERFFSKPNWMAIRMAVKTGERTKEELQSCGCDQCLLALKFMAEEESPKVCSCGQPAVVENVFTKEWVCSDCAEATANDPEPEETPSLDRPATYYSER